MGFLKGFPRACRACFVRSAVGAASFDHFGRREVDIDGDLGLVLDGGRRSEEEVFPS